MQSVPTVLPALAGLAMLMTFCGRAPGQDAEAGRTVLEILPIQQVCTQPQPTPLPIWTTATVRSSFDVGMIDHLNVHEMGRQFDPDSIQELLVNLHGQQFAEHEVAIDIDGGNLILLGHGGVVAQLQDHLDTMRRIVTRPLTVEVAFWNVSDDSPRRGILDATAYEAFASNREPLWRRRSVTRSSRPVALESSRWNAYVRDVNVEIASKSWIHCPEAESYFDGSHVVVLPHALSGSDDFVAHVQFAHSESMGPPARLSTGIPDAPQLDAIQLGTMVGTCSGRFQNGGALCLTMHGDRKAGCSAVLTVRISARPLPAGGYAIAPSMSAFPVSALTTSALLGRIGPPATAPRIGNPHGLDVEVDEENDGFGYIEEDRLSDLLYSSLDSEDQDEANIRIGGGYLFVTGSKRAAQRAAGLLEALERRLLTTVTVHHAVRGQGAEPMTLHEFVLPTLTGRYVTVARRFETNVIGDLDVEVAEEAKAVDPVVDLLQFGGWLRARVVADADRAHLDLLAQCSDCELVPTRQMLPAGAIDLAQVGTQTISHDAGVAAGQPVLHGDGPVVIRNGQRHRTTVATTVRW